MAKTQAGQRVKMLRGDRTQYEFAKLVKVSRSYLATVESGGQKPSGEFVRALHDATGVNPVWIWDGVEPMYLSNVKAQGDAAAHSRTADTRGDLEKRQGMERVLGVKASRASPVSDLPTMVLRDPGANYGEGRWLRARASGEEFGYTNLVDSRDVRLRALTNDNAIDGTQLQRVVKDGDLWDRVGGMWGWEFEELRFYFSSVGDRSVELWLHLLHFMRVSAGYAVDAGEAKGQKGQQGPKGQKK